ncbi:MAG: haloacid dehalogenase-like hydrolase [Polyangiaceae bacterium]|nr:haloacid dehalogenase-like hydrolase [Polyangiaceae bacterium]MCE7890246.1 haloacid dehalogenase-like hydrolase [Sorangiineae bacterium PRO1]
MIVKHGIASPAFDPAKRPVAVFDWDNTVVKNDIGDATLFWMLKHDVILQPPGKDWGLTNPDLTAAAKSALNAACDAAAAAGTPLPTSATPACAAEIMSIYYNGKTAAGAAAWTDANTTTTNQPYAWVSQLQAGHTPAEVRAWAQAAFEENVGAPIGTTQTLFGVSGVAGYLRIYEQIRDLAETLDENGFDVWVVTASPQYVVEAVSEKIGVPPHQVIGIRPVLNAGLITYGFEGCGTLANGQTSLITYYAGKRCWINKVIFGEPAASQLAPNPDPSKRPVFVAGDSDTDLAMLKDATVLKLVIERHKLEVSCNAWANYQNKWLHQPMFIEPKSAPAAGAFACPTGVDPDGAPIKDESGAQFPKALP